MKTNHRTETGQTKPQSAIQTQHDPNPAARKRWLGLVVGLSSVLSAAAQEVIVTQSVGIRTVMTTFEGSGGHLQPVAPDTDSWIPGSGMRFPPTWITSVRPPATFLNNPSGNTIVTWNVGSTQVVQFDEPVYEVFFHYAARGPLTVEALNVDGVVIASVIAPLSNPVTLNTWIPFSLQVSDNAIMSMRFTGQPGGRVGLDDFGYRRKVGIEVPVDVKPGNDNEIDPINLKAKGSLPLAVFSTVDFDATTLDVSTLTLGDPNLTQIATVVWGSAEDVDADGLLDVVLHFSASELVDGGAINADTTELLVSGLTTDGKSIFGKD